MADIENLVLGIFSVPMFDTHTILQVLLAAVICGIIGLDRTALGQFMISQPVVAGPLTGWLLGDVTAGLVIGGTLELIWVLDMPIGTFVPADSTVAAVAATATAALGNSVPGGLPVIGFCLLMTVTMVPVTMFADHLMRKRNAQIPELALSSGGSPTEAGVTAWHLAGLMAFFLKSFFMCLAMVPAGLLLVGVFRSLPAPFSRAMVVFVTLLPLLGASSVARKLSMNTLDRTLLIGFCVGAVSVQLFHFPEMAAIMLAAAGGWVGVRSHGA
jgi:mannose/fructose/N-acetylgalactosamine-specific phosphotransferase system component IIC